MVGRGSTRRSDGFGRFFLTAIAALLVVAAASIPAMGLGDNECPAEDLDPGDNALSLQTPAAGACYDLRDLSCAHIWADVNDVDPIPVGPYVSAGNDHPSNEEGCAAGTDPDDPDDGRSADPGVCVGANRGPDSGAEMPVCPNPGDTLDEYGISLGSELEECRRFASGEPPTPEHSQPGVCADDDGDGVPDPEVG